MSNFQTILIAVFLAFFVFAVLIFSGAINIGGLKKTTGPQGKVVIWGTFPNSTFNDLLGGLNTENKGLSASYVKKNISTYQQDLIEAFANGNGPDLFIISPDMIKKNNNFIYKVPYASYPEKSFRSAFIDGADIYLDSEGVVGLPLFVDPMVMYYNKDILSNEGMVKPPATWDELFILNQTLTKRENDGKINQSMIALGGYNNINNAKDILANLLIQNGDQIVERGVSSGVETGINFVSVLKNNPKNLSISPVNAVMQFFIEFSNPSKSAYSWNASLPNSLDMFTSGKLAMYLGKASELFNIQEINPNLSFDVTGVPQIKDTTAKRALGDIYALVVNKRSTNMTSAFSVAGILTQGDYASNISVTTSLPPVTRALLATKPEDPYLSTFFNSAVIARSWLDPNEIKTDLIFKELIGNILSNSLSTEQAINKAQGQLEVLVKE